MSDGSMPVWFGHSSADEYLLAAAHHLARAATRPVTAPLPPASASATLYCAFAAEAYVNVALVRIMGREEYKLVGRMAVRTKYFLVTRLGLREAWFIGGERVLEELAELFTERNRLVHAQPEPWVYRPPIPQVQRNEPHTRLDNVARWLNATVEAVSRLGRSHAELTEFQRVAGPLSELEPLLRNFDGARDGEPLQRAVRVLLTNLLRQDEEEGLLDEDALEGLLDEQDPDWDLRELD